MRYGNKTKFILVLNLFLFCSCTTTQGVRIKYDPIQNVEKNPEAEQVIVNVIVEDKRKDKEIIGEGPFNTKIKPKNDPKLVIENAIKNELAKMGFNIQEGNLVVIVQLIRLYSKYLGTGDQRRISTPDQ